MVSKNKEVEYKNTKDPDSHGNPVFVDTEDEYRQGACEVFHNKEVDVSKPDEVIHEGVYLLGSVVDMEDRKVGIENG